MMTVQYFNYSYTFCIHNIDVLETIWGILNENSLNSEERNRNV